LKLVSAIAAFLSPQHTAYIVHILILIFTARQHRQSAVLAMIDSVCHCLTSDRLTHAGIMPKRLQLRSCGLHWWIAPWPCSFLTVNLAAKFQREHGERGRRI